MLIYYLFKKINNFINKLAKPIRTNYYKYLVKNCAESTGKNLAVNGLSNVTPKTIIGNNVNLNGMNIRGKGKVVIGNYFHSGDNCSIWTSQHNYDKGNTIPYDDTYITNDVIIEDFVWFGSRVAIMGGGAKQITIGEGAIIQYGSVVVSSIPPYAIAGGHPAKVFKYRDKEHFNKLKEEGKVL